MGELETGQLATRQSFTRQIFFKTLKQNLNVKTFVGKSENALYIQTWTAVNKKTSTAIVGVLHQYQKGDS